ncbi:MAG: hypothetical protein R3251_00125 [Candidatus Spechtbacterales bacterium]|nr:hypothetical protein [Candidatus Spechtbacterales bacterium]
MAISLIPTKKRRGPASGLFDDLRTYAKDFLPGFAVIAVVFVIYLVTSLWFNDINNEYNELQNEKDKLFEQLKAGAASSQAEELVSRARAIEKIISNHTLSSKAFGPFEESAHPEIRVTDMSFNISAGELSLIGTAPNLEALGEQFIIWRDETLYLNDADLGNFLKDEEGIVNFNATLKVKEDYFK